MMFHQKEYLMLHLHVKIFYFVYLQSYVLNLYKTLILANLKEDMNEVDLFYVYVRL